MQKWIESDNTLINLNNVYEIVFVEELNLRQYLINIISPNGKIVSLKRELENMNKEECDEAITADKVKIKAFLASKESILVI